MKEELVPGVLGMSIHATTLSRATATILGWAEGRESRMICAADAHMTMRHRDEPAFRQTMEKADLVTPDGMSLVRVLRWKGFHGQERVCGPDLTLALCEEAGRRGIKVGFWGGTPAALEELVARLTARFPGLTVAYAYSPPFRELSEGEDQTEVGRLHQAGVQLLFVGLGCPKQEHWMASHKERVQAAMVGVGAAFDFHAGRIRRAPLWIQRAGFEWLYRIFANPRRMLGRAIRYYPRFVWHLAMARLDTFRKRAS
jgi:N-acetylglucosaminyldiphosphoundecaprenol N-acetyl-beta-D-mannosaminyltransferase